MSLFRFLWHFMELLVAVYLAAGTRSSPAWGIVFLDVSKIILKHKTFLFLFLLGLNISIAYFQKRRNYDSKETFGAISKSPPTCFPKETFSYFRQYTDTVVYFFTRASGRSDDEFSDDDDVSREEGSSQRSGECRDVASDNADGKQDDAKQETKATAGQSFPPQSARKRKGDADGEIGMKRSKFEEEDLPVERGIDGAQAVEVSSPPSSADSTDRPQALLSDSFSQDSGAANSDGTGGTGMEQVVTKPDPGESASSESMLLSPPAEKTPPSVKNSNSQESSRGEPMNADTQSKAVESKALSPEKKDRDSSKNSCTCEIGNWQRAKEVLPAESPDSVESRDSKHDNMRHMPSPRGVVPGERRLVRMDGKITDKDLPDVVSSSTEIRVSEEIARATKEFFEKGHERSKPKHPGISDKKRTGGNIGRPGGGAIRIPYEDIIKHPLFRSWPRVDRPGPSSDLGCITIYYHKDSMGKTQYYREYPGLSLQPLTVKKDANYQKRFYRHQRSVMMPIKMGEMIQWSINLCQDLIDDIPKYPTSDEDKLSLGEYHELSQQLMQAVVSAYKSLQEGEWKNRRAKKKRSAGRRKTGYVASSYQEESPSDSSSDETLYIHPLAKTSSEEDLSQLCVSPIGPSESARQPMNLQLPHFSFDCDVSRVQPQSEFLDAIAPKLLMSHHQRFHRNPEPRACRYGSYSNPRASLQPVQIKFVPETFRNSTRLIYCRDNMSFDSGENSRIRLKPFFEVEKVLQLEGRWPSVSVEEFLQALLTFQELYYQMLYDESERFYTFREHIYRCVIPMRNIESAGGEHDEDNPKPKSSDSGQSSKSVVSYGEVSSSTSETNIPGGDTSKIVEGKEVAIGSAVDTSACNKRKHLVWYPPTAKEPREDAGLDSPPDNSDTESASE